MENAFSIDVEGFLESNEESFGKHVISYDEDLEIQTNVDVVLSLLNETQTKATFFILGRIAKDMPGIVKSIASMGHEIGCHGYHHRRLYSLNCTEVISELDYAKKLLEDVSGNQVYGFRAPDFSITNNNIYVLDILKELGFIYDSSIYAIEFYDAYGVKNAPKKIYRLQNGLVEFPLSGITAANRTLPFGGGGYFRLYPLILTVCLIKKCNANNIPCIVYLHPYEIGPSIPRLENISAYRRFRHYYNCSTGYKRTKRLLHSFSFCETINLVRRIQ